MGSDKLKTRAFACDPLNQRPVDTVKQNESLTCCEWAANPGENAAQTEISPGRRYWREKRRSDRSQALRMRPEFSEPWAIDFRIVRVFHSPTPPRFHAEIRDTGPGKPRRNRGRMASSLCSFRKLLAHHRSRTFRVC